ncbi:MAG: PBP1A family penicillin-binding protein [Clostridia bacterium]|nr:PBP1A family penicillin-binding protein [Clostridia bacterium]
MKKRTSKKKKKNTLFKFILKTIGLIVLCTFAICLVAFGVYLLTLDSTVDIGVETMNLNYTSTVCYVDDSGVEHEYEDLYATQNRSWVDLENMPKHLKYAAIAIEDERFESHNGVDWYRTFGAAANLFLNMRSDFGGSTITQQLIKNLTGDKRDTVRRKLQEIMRALYIERHYSKDTIIELYLNTIYLSQGCYGVSTAAEVYFDKDVSELTLAECASLVGITNLPTYYDPFINPDNNLKRQRNTLAKMLEIGSITQEEYDEAIAQELVFKKKSKEERIDSNIQSYFVDQVIEDVIDDLMEEQGLSYQVAERMIFSGGLKIYATIDPKVQSAMEDVFENDDNYPTASGKGKPECAMVVMDPYTGEVRGIVGGRGRKTQNRGWNRATQTFRQPGSSIKPIAVYAPAVEYGLINPQTAMDDSPFTVLNGKAYPKNETQRYQGRMTITKALMESINTISVKTLNELTPERSFNFMTTNLGFSKLNKKSDKNLAPLALGGLTTGVSTMEMAAAYSSFVNQGTYIEPHTYTKVLDNQGNVILQKKPHVVDAMSSKTASYMNYMLSKVMGPGGTGNLAKLNNNMPAAGKTGTTDDDKDRWYVGYTPYYSAAVWYGYDQPKTIAKGLSPALTTWKKVMNAIHKDLPNKNFDYGDDFKYVNVCSCSGLLPNEYCRSDIRGTQVIAGFFHKDDVPTKRCTVHTGVDLDSATMQKPTEFCPAGNIKTFGLLNLSRSFPLSGIVVGDEQYAIHTEAPKSGEFYFASPKTTINETCSAHSSAPITQPSDDEPTDEDDAETTDDTTTEDQVEDESTVDDESDSSEDPAA